MHLSRNRSFSIKERTRDRSGKVWILKFIIILSILLVLLYVFSERILKYLGEWLVVAEEPVHSDAVVVLYTGVDYYPRLVEAAALYRRGMAEQVVINGNRKSDSLRELEKKGFFPCCFWYEDTVRMLDVMGVPGERIMAVSVEDAYDTVSEAEAVGEVLKDAGMSSLIITTSKFHSRRAGYIWKRSFPDEFRIRVAAARSDPYRPDAWWKEGRQIRWVLSEYGAWIYYFWKTGSRIRD